MLNRLKSDLRKLAKPKTAKTLQRFFKTGQGEYGQGDIFLGVTVPQQRQLVKKYSQLKLSAVEKLLHSKIHEYRFTSLLILLQKYKKSNISEKQKIYNLCLKNIKWVNSWDLVDLTAPRIIGNYLINKNKKILYQFAKSNSLWQKRIAIIATYEFIKHRQYSDTLKISNILLSDPHDLTHKAVGWMLREVGKLNEKKLIKFLDKHISKMPRTMLRYAIEKFPEQKRKYYLNK